ncbi:hypothetical protein RM190_15825 [Paracoccus sp. CPCC 101403]|uniref:Uncharacterized protein n=1 Tax=Paracoccus broussonetiae TaxID=3075834 RepID=A0ABU3EGM3_9RHOB|nr:hypothetical protein [Paracoccus sp. CPCC 101403]MDT1063344.1 hypothetical protein [Paracoccus sp. CPCC 101403]
MARCYRYTARRKVDGAVITTDTIRDIDEQGMGRTAHSVRSALAGIHPMAKDLSPDEIDIHMSVILLGR